MQLESDLIVPWRGAPAEATGAFQDAFSHIARAIQVALREYVPPCYFSSLARYADRERAFPMLVYQCSRPLSFRQGREFTHDLLNSLMMRNLFWSLRTTLPRELTRLEESGIFAGDLTLARMYAQRRYSTIVQFVRSHRKPLDRILATETSLVNALIQFASALPAAHSEERAVQRLEKSWKGSLSRIYFGVDASPLYEQLIGLATQTLLRYQRMPSEIPEEIPTTSA